MSAPVRVYELEGVGALRTRSKSPARAASRVSSAAGRDGGPRGGARGGDRRAAGRSSAWSLTPGREEPAVLRVRRALPRARHPRSTRRTGSGARQDIPFLPVLELLRELLRHHRERQRPRGAPARSPAELMLLLDETFTGRAAAPLRFPGRPDPERPAPRHGARGTPAAALRHRAAPGAGAQRTRAGGRSSSRTCTGSTAAAKAFLEQCWSSRRGRHALLSLVNFRPEYHAELDGRSPTTSSCRYCRSDPTAIA